MCESCESEGISRRGFLGMGLGASAGSAWVAHLQGSAAHAAPGVEPEKSPARVMIVFMYPPDQVVLEGKLEDNWAPSRWFTWPGNQFEPDQKRREMTAEITRICEALNIRADVDPQATYTTAQVAAYIARAKSSNPDALLIVNFWNTFSEWVLKIVQETGLPSIVYHPVGSSHQLPPKGLMSAEGLYYIHSIDNWTELENGLRAVNARVMLHQSRLLRIGDFPERRTERESHLGVEVMCLPAQEYIDLFDSIVPDQRLRSEAMSFKKMAERVKEVTDDYLVDAFRAHRTVQEIMKRHAADAITIKCLMLQARKPCISFSLNNSALTPCACEDAPDSAMTLMLVRWLFDRPGFQHNPDFDVNRNLYFGAHCTCALKLHGPSGPAQKFWIRPFFHQMPKTPALDVEWTPQEPVLLAKYLSEKRSLSCWRGRVVESPASTSAGGCATRALVEIDQIDDVCSIYSGPHPILCCANRAESVRMKAFAKLSRLKLVGNI